MIIMKNFTTSTANAQSFNYSIATDDTGADWYASQENFQDDTLKVVFDSAGVIISLSYDVSVLWPGGNSVAEVAPADVPDGLNIDGGWVFDGEKITARVYTPEELAVQITAEKTQRLATAQLAIMPLQNAVKHNMATDEDKARLEAWEKYSVLVSRVIPEKPDWPKMPEG